MEPVQLWVDDPRITKEPNMFKKFWRWLKRKAKAVLPIIIDIVKEKIKKKTDAPL